jgi:hypothetical protein
MKLQTLAYHPASRWSAPFDRSWDSERTLVLVFGASNLAEESSPVVELANAFPRSHVLGCSTAGEILGAKLGDGGLAVAIARFERTEIAATHAAIDRPEQSFGAGRALASALLRPDLRALFVLSDGLHVNGSELVGGLSAVLPESVIVTGGLAGDGDRFQSTWVLHEGRPATNIISCVAFYGDAVRISHGSRGGWDKFGPERRITRSRGNVLYELDGKPALQLYRQYLGERASGLPATGLLFPLAIRYGAEEDKTLVRTILGIDDAEQSMTFAGDVPEGALAQLMRANFERLIAGAAGAAELTSSRLSHDAAVASDWLSIAISCVGRRLVLGERTEEELEVTLEGLPRGTQQVGFYSYGEISPYATGRCDLHNQTMTLTAIGEELDRAA